MRPLLRALWSRFVSFGDWLTRADQLFCCRHLWKITGYEEIGEKYKCCARGHCLICGKEFEQDA